MLVKVIRNDKNYPLNFQLFDAKGDYLDLSSVTSMTLKIQFYNSPNLIEITNYKVTDASKGEGYFTVAEEFVGSFYGEGYGEIEIQIGSQTVTTEPFSFKILKDL